MRELTQGRGTGTVWDCVGGSEFLRLSISCVRPGGTVPGRRVAAGRDFARGGLVRVPRAAGAPAGVRGVTRRDQQLCTGLTAKRSIEPVIDRTFGLAPTAGAHACPAWQHYSGRLVLRP